MNLIKKTLFLILIVGIIFYFQFCSSSSSSIPTLSFSQYGFENGAAQSKEKSDIVINLKTIRIGDIYEYPDLFSFTKADFPKYEGNYIYKTQYPKGPLGKKWEFPFSTPKGKEQSLLCWVKVRNNTDHILRMGDARIYLIKEGQNPINAINNFDKLLDIAKYFETKTNIYLEQNSPSFMTVSLPNGFFQSIVKLHKESYKLINNLNTEILPGYSYEGLLVFPETPTEKENAKISFFDVTTKTDKAGNPVEKTTFNFKLVSENINMWFDRSQNKWKNGTPQSQ